MQKLENISIGFGWNVWILVLLIIVSISISYYFYRNTIPPVSDFKRYFLMSIRAFVLILFFLIVFEPIFSLTYVKEETPVIAVLIDNSASMGIKDKLVSRKEKLLEIIKNS